MALTESQAGSDVGLIRTRAEQVDEAGRYRLSGSKIFISGGDLDLTDNILHLVLARLPGAQVGSRGLSLSLSLSLFLSLFLVPKWLLEGTQQRLNAVRFDGIELKRGIRGSAMCGLLLLDFVWLRTARLAADKAEDVFYAQKLETAAFFHSYLLPEAEYRLRLIEASAAELPFL